MRKLDWFLIVVAILIVMCAVFIMVPAIVECNALCRSDGCLGEAVLNFSFSNGFETECYCIAAERMEMNN